MARYFFDLRDGEFIPDPVGTELTTVDDARNEAARRMAGLLQADPGKFWGGEEWHMEVKNKDGLILFSLCVVGHDAPAMRRDRPF